MSETLLTTGGEFVDGLPAPALGPTDALLGALAELAARQQQAWMRLLQRQSD